MSIGLLEPAQEAPVQQVQRRKRVHECETEMMAMSQDHSFSKVLAISKGNWGVSQVWRKHLADGTSRLYSLMFVPRGLRVNHRLKKAVLTHIRLNQPHLTNLMEVCVLPNYLVLAKEHTPGYSLYNRTESKGVLEEAEARWYFQQLVIAVEYLHRKGVAHKQIKLENCILHAVKKGKAPLLKLTGFLTSQHDLRGHTRTSSFRAFVYRAPELWDKLTCDDWDEKAVDMFCLGVVLFKMVIGDYPFPDPGRITKPEEAEAFMGKLMWYDDEPEISEPCRNLLEGLLRFNPEERLTMAEVLEHPFFRENLTDACLRMNADADETPMREYRNRQTPEAVSSILEIASIYNGQNQNDQINFGKDMSVPEGVVIYDDHEEQESFDDERNDFNGMLENLYSQYCERNGCLY